jgi:hypothetical protein
MSAAGSAELSGLSSAATREDGASSAAAQREAAL